MNVAILSGSAHPALAADVCGALGVEPAPHELERFPDGEIRAEVGEAVRGRDVYVIQPTSPPAGEHLLELLLLADACARAGAARVTAVVPYFGYARQDRRTRPGAAVGGRVVADVLAAGGRFDRIVAVHLHTASVEGFLPVPLDDLPTVDLLAEAARPHVGDDSVVVAPDVGAAKLARELAMRLGLPSAMVHKARLDGTRVAVHGVIGEVAGRRPLVVDDIISTAGTMAAAIQAVLDQGAAPDVTLAVTHALLVDDARARLAALPIRRLIATDSVPPPTSMPPFTHEVVPLAPRLAETIRRLHGDRRP